LLSVLFVEFVRAKVPKQGVFGVPAELIFANSSTARAYTTS
jgi:hypothetical protein